MRIVGLISEKVKSIKTVAGKTAASKIFGRTLLLTGESSDVWGGSDK